MASEHYETKAMTSERHEIVIIISSSEQEDDFPSEKLFVTQIDESKHPTWLDFFGPKMFETLGVGNPSEIEVHDKNAPFDKPHSKTCLFNLEDNPSDFVRAHKSRVYHKNAKKKKKVPRFTVKLVPKYGVKKASQSL